MSRNVNSFGDGINLPPQNSPPSNPREGDVYNDALLGFQGYTGGRWVTLLNPTVPTDSTAFISNPITTTSAAINTSTFTTFNNSPAFTFTPVVSGTYKVYSNIPLYSDASNVLAQSRIFNTSGGATLISEDYGDAYGSASNTLISVPTMSKYKLIAGNTYVFDIQGRWNSAGTASSNIQNYGAYGTFYMHAELCSTVSEIGSAVITNPFFNSSQVTTQSGSIAGTFFVNYDNSPTMTVIPSVSGLYRVYCPVPMFTSLANTIGFSRIFNTSANATTFIENASIIYGDTNTSIDNPNCETFYELTAGVTYTFDIQGRIFSAVGGHSISNVGNIVPFAMICELIGGTQQDISLSVDLSGNYPVSANNPIKYNTVVWDSNSAYDTGTGFWTCPTNADGRYSISVVGNAHIGGGTLYVGVDSGGGPVNVGYLVALATLDLTYSGSRLITLAAGDIVGIYIDNSSTMLGNIPSLNNFSLHKV